jgi:uncharacterized protein with gpF-like domain
LRSWSSLKFGAMTKQITHLRKDLQKLQFSSYQANINKIANINKRLDELLLRKEMMWKQRSRVKDYLVETWRPKHTLVP